MNGRHVYERMVSFLSQHAAAPGTVPYLSNYKEDFTVHDRRYLHKTYASGATYLWGLRESGSHLYRINATDSENRHAKGLVFAGISCDLYLVTEKSGKVSIKPVTSKRAHEMLRVPQKWNFVKSKEGAAIYREGAAWGFIAHTNIREREVPFNLDISVPREHQLDWGAIYLLSINYCISRAGTLFANLGGIRVNGVDCYSRYFLQ